MFLCNKSSQLSHCLAVVQQSITVRAFCYLPWDISIKEIDFNGAHFWVSIFQTNKKVNQLPSWLLLYLGNNRFDLLFWSLSSQVLYDNAQIIIRGWEETNKANMEIITDIKIPQNNPPKKSSLQDTEMNIIKINRTTYYFLMPLNFQLDVLIFQK